MPPPPPPPPPPGPGPPGPPPPPMGGAPAPRLGAMPDRKGLLGDIAKGRQLKKAVTNDRSAPTVGGGVVVSGNTAPTIGRPPTIPSAARSAISTDVDSTPAPSAPQLGGLFAGGMPTLKKTTNGVRNGAAPDSGPGGMRSVSSPITRPPVPSASAPRAPPSAPSHRPSVSVSSPLSAPPPPPPAAPPSIPPAPPVPSMLKSAITNSSPNKPAMPPPIARKASNQLAPPTAPPARPTSNPPTLPSAPPPPLPTSVSPAPSRFVEPPPPRSIAPPPPPPVFAAVSPSMHAPPPPPPIQSQTSPSTNLDGLQAALASRSHSQASPSRSTSLNQSVASAANGQDYNETPSTASYSLKPQAIKRVDDSKYRFQPDSSLPPIRQYTNCLKAYKSGRPGGSTVPLNLAAL